MTLWEVLGVPEGCSDDDLKKAYRKKVMELHPDKTGNDPNKTKLFLSMKDVYEKVVERRKIHGIERPRPVQESHNPFSGMASSTATTSTGNVNIASMYFNTQDLYRVYQELQGDGRIGKQQFDDWLKKRNRASDILRGEKP